MAQLLTPVSDQATGIWTNAPLWSKANADDNTDAISDAVGNNTDTSNADLKLASGSTPQAGTQTLRVRWHHDQGGRSLQATCELYQGDPASGGSLIATLQSATDVGTAEVEDSTTVTGISDYTDLYVRLRGRGTGGGPSRSLHVDLVELSIPDAGANPVTVELVAATATVTPQPLNLSLTALSTELSPASLATAAQALTPSLGSLSVALAPADLTLSAQALDPGESTTIDVSPLDSGDDGRRHSFGLFDATATPYVGVTSPDLYAWFRFPNATIPQGATIDVAHISLTGVGGADGTVRVLIAGVDEDDHVAPTDNDAWVADHGIHTTATVTDSFTQDDAIAYQSPSLVSIIQEIVDREGWASGNAIGIHIDENGTDADAVQQFADVDGGTGNEAVLHVEHTTADLGVEIELAPASLQSSAQALSLSLDPLSVGIAPVSLALSAQTLGVSLGAATVELAPATMTLTPQSLNLSLGALSVSLSPATVSLVAQALGVNIAGASVEVELVPAAASLVAQALGVTVDPLSVALAPASTILTPQTLGVSLGVQTVELTPSTLSVAAQALGVSVDALDVELVAAEMSLVALALGVDIVGGEDPFEALRVAQVSMVGPW